MKRTRMCCLLARQLSLLSLLSFAGCMIVPPTRVTTAIKTPAGKAEALSPLVAEPGKTTRRQVEEQYHAFAVDTGVPNLFWARYLESRWYAAVYPAPPGRIWKTRNILVSFDESGFVKTEENIPDTELIARFVGLQKAGAFPPLDLSSPIQVAGMEGYPTSPMTLEVSSRGLTITLAQRTLKLSKTKPSPATHGESQQPSPVFIPLEQIIGLQILDAGNFLGNEFMTPDSQLELKFSQKTALGKNFSFYLKQHAVLTLVRWMEQEKTAKQ